VICLSCLDIFSFVHVYGEAHRENDGEREEERVDNYYPNYNHSADYVGSVGNHNFFRWVGRVNRILLGDECLCIDFKDRS
jgi:hypothetical protein